MTGHPKSTIFLAICLLLALGIPGSSPVLAQDEESAEEPVGWPRDLDTRRA